MIVPISFESLSDKDKEGALEAVNLIGQKNVDRSKEGLALTGLVNTNLSKT